MTPIVRVARRLLLVPVVAAAYGWQDRVRAVPGPRIRLVLPLQEPSHHASGSLLGVVAVWLLAFAIAAVLVPVERTALAALVRAGAVFAVLLALQAASIELVREATTGFAWRAALGTPAPAVAAACAAISTAATAALRRGAEGQRHEKIEAAPEGQQTRDRGAMGQSRRAELAPEARP